MGMLLRDFLYEKTSCMCCYQEGGEEGEGGVEGEEKDHRVSVIDTSTGKKLTGELAPLKSELEKWLQDHPQYVLSTCDFINDNIYMYMYI